MILDCFNLRKKNLKISKSCDYIEMRNFHLMLCKMKKKRPNFNVDRVMQLLYDGFFNEEYNSFFLKSNKDNL